MEIRYYIDPRTANPHIHTHDVFEHEVEEVLARPGEDRPGSNGSRVIIGQTDAGRYLRVIYIRDPEPDSVFASRLMNSQENLSKRTGDVRKGERYEDQ